MTNHEPSAWLCDVCGYVHYGPKPPDECPVCGVEAEFFEPYVEAAPVPAAAGAQDWRCLNCSYIQAGPEPPDHCPVCDAPRDRFEAHDVEPVAQTAGGGGLRVVIAGAGIAGVSAAEALRKRSPQAEILLLSREPELPYYRLNLTRYLAGEVAADQLTLHPEEWYSDRNIKLMLGGELKSIDADGKRAVLQDGTAEDYDKLVLTAGAHAFVPPFPGTDRGRVSVLRTLADAQEILGAARGGCRCVIIGGGILGLETAGALAQSGVEVTLVEGYGWLLPRQLNEPAGRLLEEYVRSVGISLRKSARTQELEGDEVVRNVRLDDGTALPADLVIITTGVRCNSYLARQAGLDVNRGVIVDNQLRTSQPDIYAAGDMAEHRGVSYGLWGPAQFQGTIAGMNAAGDSVEFAGIPRSNMLKVLGYDMFSIGQIRIEDASSRAIDGAQNRHYYCFIFRDNHLVGSILMGDTALSSAAKKLIEGQVDCSGVLRGQPELEQILDFLRDQS